MGSDAALLLERPSWGESELVDSLARDLAELPAPAAIVIDDAQFAEASQRALAMLAQRLPAHVRLVVASQHNPVFSTSRLRLTGLITELRAEDLAFTQVEVEQLLEHTPAQHVTAAAIPHLPQTQEAVMTRLADQIHGGNAHFACERVGILRG